MFVKKYLIFISVFSLLSLGLYAQSSTISPFSRYGYGDIHSGGFTIANSMGGVGYGVRSNSFINMKNPASYSAVDSLTFMFDFGGSTQFSQFTSAVSRQPKSNAQFDYISLQIPILKNMGMSLGLLPFSSVGYEYSFDETIIFNSDELLTNHAFSGMGGISQAYAGLAYTIVPQLSFGVNAKYLFGNIVHTRSLSFPDNSTYISSNEESNTYISTFVADFGVQYMQTIANKDKLVLGATYTMKTPMNMDSEVVTTTTQTITDDTSYLFDYPQSIGLGVSYRHDNRFLFALDYTNQAFSDALFYTKTDSLQDVHKFALGVEYLPKAASRSYVETIRYRLGANMANSYTKVNGNSYTEYGVSLGFGLPLKNSKSILNFLVEYGTRGSLNYNLVREDYLKIGLGLSVNEAWFFKRKFE
ncbi:MAG: hypothetical protein KA373_02195 [Paludibacteraceae bacterium]|nr:hypothetical protein [Paludibacteraceae bacterium]